MTACCRIVNESHLQSTVCVKMMETLNLRLALNWNVYLRIVAVAACGRNLCGLQHMHHGVDL